MTTVLLAEDDAAIAEPLSRALQREGYEVDVATDGAAALERVRRRRRSTCSCSTSACPGWTGWRCAGGCGRTTPTCRC